MENEIVKQEKALSQAQAKALALRTASHSPASVLGIVQAIYGMTQALLLVARIVNRWSTEAYSRSELEIERRAR